MQQNETNQNHQQPNDNSNVQSANADSNHKSEDELTGSDNLTAVLQKIAPDDESGKTSIGDIMETLESRGFGPLLFAPALIAVMPTGGIPGVPTVCGVVIASLSIQMVFGKDQPWLPDFVNKIDFEKEKLQKGVDIASKVTKQVDKVSKPRIEQLSSDTAKKAIAIVCTLAAIAMMPLEIVPFAVMIPALSIILFAIGLITKDGYIILAAFLLNLATLYFVVTKVIGG